MANSHLQKRKNPPDLTGGEHRENRRDIKRLKTINARSVLVQTDDPTSYTGELNLQNFLKAREYEIKALEDGMQRSKGARSTRAFQTVPRDLRRRTASHNVKKVPQRLRDRAKKEMLEDKTPTITAKKRKPRSTRARLRSETAKRLGLLAAKKKKDAVRRAGCENVVVTRPARSKIRKDALNEPPKAKSKFRKRQIHKTWLPTHLWHAKRAKMTEPKEPLWRFAIPLTPTEKSYRPTHRSIGSRGAVIWDVSYMSTIGLYGTVESLALVLIALGVTGGGLWELNGEKWRNGKRMWSGWLSKSTSGRVVHFAPANIAWAALRPSLGIILRKNALHRSLFIRIHPAAFQEAWTEILRLSRSQRPLVHVEDLRFDIGSIEIAGPGSTEALLGILHPCKDHDAHAEMFSALAGVTNPASLPPNTLLSLSVMDPRLRYPPRQVEIPALSSEREFELLQTLSNWPVDFATPSSGLFDRDIRFKASRLASQKAINRRKGLAAPGEYPPAVESDPAIPIMLFTSRGSQMRAAQGTWTLLAPWKCILPIWYGLAHYPSSSGSTPRFGGLEEARQTQFENGIPWFPADYPASQAGFEWELQEREKRRLAWEKRPKGKRVEWATLDLGVTQKGEIGRGWACDFEWLINLTIRNDGIEVQTDGVAKPVTDDNKSDRSLWQACQYLQRKDFLSMISSPAHELPLPATVATVRITLLSGGVGKTCARVYRLPLAANESSSQTSEQSKRRQHWLSLRPASAANKPVLSKKGRIPQHLHRLPLDVPIPERIRRLAQTLLQNPPLQYPAFKDGRDGGHPIIPSEHDLIGFITTGGFNLAEGNAVAIATVLVGKTLESLRTSGKSEGMLCIVRNAGQTVGRLAKWEAV